MRAKTLRTAAAALVVLGLLAAAAPARGEGGIGPALLHHLTAWLAGLWPGGEPSDVVGPAGPVGLAQRLGSDLDPHGEPAAGSPPGPAASSDDDPTAEPELGPRADPDG